LIKKYNIFDLFPDSTISADTRITEETPQEQPPSESKIKKFVIDHHIKIFYGLVGLGFLITYNYDAIKMTFSTLYNYLSHPLVQR